ncbi:hypothetical protein M5K25_006704 [Dendrobium thyrsiflorum]|uniref:Uncharacterized protein n=1 Tax=Dendrobium thyrsiflorum TaxID=117978 RepID=A0ABD0VDI2_DENTH
MNSDLPFSYDHPAFWVRRAARNPFDALPGSVLESELRANENEYNSLPHWLENIAKTSTPLLPWLPVNVSHLQRAATFELAKKSRSKELVSKNGKIKPLLESEDIFKGISLMMVICSPKAGRVIFYAPLPFPSS